MSAAPNRPADDNSPYVLYSDGKTLVFDSIEEMREWGRRPLTDQERAAGLRALELMDQLHAMILKRTNGKGIAEEDLDEAIRFAKDH